MVGTAESLVAEGLGRLLVSVVAALISGLAAELIRKWLRKGPRGRWPLWGILIGAIVFGAVYLVIPAPPAVDIKQPADGQLVPLTVSPENGYGTLDVAGSSKGVAEDQSLRIYVLVHPLEPFAAGWWVQPSAACDADGQWNCQARYGSKEYPPAKGSRLQIIAVVARASDALGTVHVDDPKNLKPQATSKIHTIVVGSITTVPSR